MLVAIQAQKPIPFGGIMGDDIHIWNKDLARIDDILRDEQFIDILRRALRRTNPKSNTRGARRMALNRTLRTAALKHIKNWSFRQVREEMERNLDYRAFTQFFDDKIRSFCAISRNIARVDAQGVRELNERVTELAREHKIISGKSLRQDTTVCETNIHYPTDSTLMRDGIRVLTRLVKSAEQSLPSLGRMRDRVRAALHRVLEINRASRSQRPDGGQRRKKSYHGLMRITRSVVTHAVNVAKKLGDGRVTRHLDIVDQLAARAVQAELETMTGRVEKVLRQTRVRICRGITNYPDKILSLFVPETCVIRKGKAHKPTEFGRLIEIDEVENGFVSDYQVPQRVPDDSTLLIPALERHKERFGYAPRKAATDRGFWSAENEKKAYELGVKKVSIPAKGRLGAVRRALQRSRWFRALQRWRANGEGRIGTLKNSYGLDRCMYKGKDAMERWVGWCVFANNLVVVARKSRGRV